MTQPTYTISQLTKEFGVTPRTLRFYEEKGIVRPRRDGLRRIYTADHREALGEVIAWRAAGLTLDQCKKALATPAAKRTALLLDWLGAIEARAQGEVNAAKAMSAILYRSLAA